MSATTNSNNTSSSSSAIDFPSKAEGIALCSAFALEAVLIDVGNLLTIFLFATNKKLRKKILFLVINMAFADVMLGAVSLPLYVYSSVGPSYQLWRNPYEVDTSLHVKVLFDFFNTVCSQASLISAVFISCDRFYAIYWPLKHRTLSKRAYRILICMLWTLDILVSIVFSLPPHLISSKIASSAWMSFTLISLFIVCSCNIGIWRKFQHGNMATQQQNRAFQNQRLTKTLLFVSVIAVLSWLPLIVTNYLIWVSALSLPRSRVLLYYVIVIFNFSNSFVNPFVYALRIPEFRQDLGLSCLLRSQPDMNKEGNERRKNGATALTPTTQLKSAKQLTTDPSHLQLEFDNEVMDSQL